MLNAGSGPYVLPTMACGALDCLSHWGASWCTVIHIDCEEILEICRAGRSFDPYYEVGSVDDVVVVSGYRE